MKYQFEHKKIKHCWECPFKREYCCEDHSIIQCTQDKGSRWNYDINTKPYWCPLVEVPQEQGRN